MSKENKKILSPLLLFLTLEGSKVQKDRKESRDKVTSRNMLTVWVPHGVYIVYIWTMEIKSRVQGMTSRHMYMACWP